MSALYIHYHSKEHADWALADFVKPGLSTHLVQELNVVTEHSISLEGDSRLGISRLLMSTNIGVLHRGKVLTAMLYRVMLKCLLVRKIMNISLKWVFCLRWNTCTQSMNNTLHHEVKCSNNKTTLKGNSSNTDIYFIDEDGFKNHNNSTNTVVFLSNHCLTIKTYSRSSCKVHSGNTDWRTKNIW